jgi:hypothetical protein
VEELVLKSAAQFLKNQYLYFCTIKASKRRTSQVEELVLKSAAHAQQVKLY